MYGNRKIRRKSRKGDTGVDFTMNEVYWRIYWNARTAKLIVVTMQHFDEDDYNQSAFCRGEDGEKMRWEREEDAVLYLNKHFKAEFIDDEFVSPNNRDFLIDG